MELELLIRQQFAMRLYILLVAFACISTSSSGQILTETRIGWNGFISAQDSLFHHPIDAVAPPWFPDLETPLNRSNQGPEGLDTDGDGLLDSDEIRLGTDALNVDSDCDTIDDGTEVGSDVNQPLDQDFDGIIDALESRFADSDLDSVPDPVDPTSGWQLTGGKFFPFAVKNRRCVRGDAPRSPDCRRAGVTAVKVGTLFPIPVLLDGIPLSRLGNEIELFDNGAGGDRIAGDGIWSRNGITSTADASLPTSMPFDQVTATDAGGTVTRFLFDVMGFGPVFEFGVIAPEPLEEPLPIAPNAQTTSHLINLIAPLQLLEVQKFIDFDFGRPIRLFETTQMLYDLVGEDLFDFILFFPESPVHVGIAGREGTVQHNIEGIGADLFDDTASWGSMGKLQSVVTLNFGAGPTLHEVMHRWAVHLTPDLGFGSCGGSSHWGVAGVGMGQLGGFDPTSLVDNGDGTFTAAPFSPVANGGDYVSLELYLMGLASASEVPDIPIPQNVDCNSAMCTSISPIGLCERLSFRASGLTTVTLQDIINRHGPRIPDVLTSQKGVPAHHGGGISVPSQRERNGLL